MKTLKQILAESLASSAKTAKWPSEHATHDAGHTKTPYHKELSKHGYKYTHSVRKNQNITEHHYTNDDGHHVKVTTYTHVQHKMEADPHYPRRNDGKGKEY